MNIQPIPARSPSVEMTATETGLAPMVSEPTITRVCETMFLILTIELNKEITTNYWHSGQNDRQVRTVMSEIANR